MTYTQYIVENRKVVSVRKYIPACVDIVKYISEQHSDTHPKQEVCDYSSCGYNVFAILHKKIQYDCKVEDSFISLVHCDTVSINQIEVCFPNVDFNFAKRW